MPDFSNNTLLVTGAGGHLGQIVIDYLVEHGASKVIAGTRDPAKLAHLAAKGVQVRRIDLDDAESLSSGFAGVDRLLLISTDSLGRRIAQQTGAIAAAEAAGVQHVVYTSAPTPTPSKDFIVGDEHFWTEARLFSSRMDWTVLRNHLYAEYVVPTAVHAVQSGNLYDGMNGRGRAYVSRVDAARAAAGALLTAEGKSIHDITGPEALTHVELAALIADIAGKPVSSVPVPPEAIRSGLVSAGVPEVMAKVLMHFDIEAGKGFHDIVTDAVERFSGSKPASLRSVLEANRAAFAG